MRRTVFNEDHEAFRETLRAFIEAEVVPVYDDWFAAGQAPREFYYKLGELGIFGINVPEEFGGAGMDSHKFEAVLYEETARAASSSAAPASTCCSPCPTSTCWPPTSRRSATCRSSSPARRCGPSR